MAFSVVARLLPRLPSSRFVWRECPAASRLTALYSPFSLLRLQSTAVREPLEDFIDPYEVDKNLPPPGRRWRASEIRLKSDQDLEKLWVVLMKERNMLYSVKMLHHRRKTKMPYPDRIRKVRKSMAMIKVVLGERDRAKLMELPVEGEMAQLKDVTLQVDESNTSEPQLTPPPTRSG
mmetsp:Transcript_27369/g.45642  ORF Transcript_27369/g.45642 Transcript_27369/m.45642 type:complete len:177 (+) Transcript_27369:32-562(+)